MTKVKFLMGEKAIVKEAKALVKVGQKYRDRLNIVLLSALSHAHEHRDTRIIDQVFALVDVAVNRKGITAWIQAGTNLNVQVDAKTQAVTFRKPKDADLSIEMEKLQAKPFWDFKAAPMDKPFDLDAAIISLIGRAETFADEKADMVMVGTGKTAAKADMASFALRLNALKALSAKGAVKAAVN